ncbi:Glutamate N-acetyltransferase @ N-acetylglutamate synthase [hydrothermal vent metagenome]|uniref:glutamate N-acetyltransferase n=1 Tax=hydrothermal vent metagenome TaxID=652676 RepID=A0A3B0XXQ8_9ZZZZ
MSTIENTVSNISEGNAQAVAGIKLGSANSHSKYQDRDDLVLLQIDAEASVAAVFTQNLFCAAPVIVAQEHMQQSTPQYLLINAGNANAGTGDQGLHSARSLCQTVAALTHCQPSEVIPFSTGVIGESMAVEAYAKAIPFAFENLSADGWALAANSILTTDLVSKTASVNIELDGVAVTISGMCKGSGMIHPNMATMLAYVATDVSIAPELLPLLLESAVGQSFNSITVDGDTSTNDACVLIATHQADNKKIEKNSQSAQLFAEALNLLMISLAQQIIRDGEGATKFITLNVTGAIDKDSAKTVAFTVAHSPLVKTALFASDPNWGRILAAIGRAPVKALNINTIDIALGQVPVIEKGLPAEHYTEEKGMAIFSESEIVININLGNGQGRATVWTTDLSYDYVKINAEYRS